MIKSFHAQERQVLIGRKPSFARVACLMGASALALSLGAQNAAAQTNDFDDEIISTGIRASLERSQDIKRNSNGVVDSISAEDIGKFPDTNLAESLQRITGVSINRVNGEGSQVTVRGFGPEFNLVTLNGRTLPGADASIAGGDFVSGDGANTRAFDFSNLASEAVSGIDVFKTGNATLPSGGIGATIDIKTSRPLDNPGFRASIGAKGVVDTSVVQGSDVTPEFNGLVSWTDPSEKFGIGLFGSFQQRDSAAPSGTVFRFQTFTAEDFLNNAAFVGPDTNIVNAPTDPNQLVGVAIDSRLNFSELERERINLNGVVQFAPTDNFTVTADALFARNDNNELRSEIGNWFGAQFTEVVFDTGQSVATAQQLTADFTSDDGSFNKDSAFAQNAVSTRDELTSFGLNLDWQAKDNLRFVLDGHISSSEVSPNQTSEVFGETSNLFVATAATFTSAQTQLFLPGQAPIQIQTADTANVDGVEGFTETDLGTTFQGASSTFQDNEVNEIDFKTEWEPDENSKITFGVNYRDQENEAQFTGTQQFLGFFGASNPGDVAAIAPGVLQPFCVTCQFDDFPVAATDATGVTFRPNTREDLIGLFDTLSPIYENLGTPNADPNFPDLQFAFDGLDTTLASNGSSDTVVSEEIISLFAQFDNEFEIAGRPARFSIGLRYEDTDLTSVANFSQPTLLTQTSDNDFILDFSADTIPLAVENDYTNFLPHANVAVDLTDDVVFRAAYANTIARPSFGALSPEISNIGTPAGGPTALGAPSGANQGNPLLLPTEADNFDASVEWYYDDASFISIGGFHKVVTNFIGNSTVDTVSFPDLFDPTSGLAGSRSGDALDIINANGIPATPANLFLLTSLVDDLGAATAADVFIDTVGLDGVINIEGGAEIAALTAAAAAAGGDLGVVSGNAADAAVLFSVNQPDNSQTATISGLEVAAQHFFGDSGFGIAGSYTFVTGNDAADLDVTAPVGSTQFALTGLSDTANITGIYENHGISARVSYNWRDDFLSNANRGGGFDTPVFVQEFGQLDANISYDVTENIVLSFEAINITGENFVTFGRSRSQVLFAQELSPRYLFGARYKF